MGSVLQLFAGLLLAGVLAACGGGGGGGGDAASTTAPATAATPAAAGITSQPADQSVVAGMAATFTVVASAATAYQWQRSTDGGATFTAIVGATAAAYTSPAASIADSGTQYRVVVSGAANSVTSSAATLTVAAAVVAPSISVQPADRSIFAGQDASFSVTAAGTNLAYQWQGSLDGVTFSDLPGETHATLTLPSVPLAASSSRVRVVVSNTVGTVTSTAALLTVTAAQAVPAFTTQPVSATVVAPAGATFTAVASGVPTPTLQWQRSTDGGATFVDMVGATNATFVVSATADGDAVRIYRVVATNTAGSTPSNVATLTVNPASQAPAITAQPAAQTVAAGAIATFTAQASGTPTPTWQWQLSSDGGGSFANINGATSPSYATPATTLADNGKRFRAIATNVAGSAISAAPLLTVTPPANRMASARIAHTATLLASGKVLVAAGVVDGSSGGFFSSAETFDPASAVWSNVASLAQARGFHTATRLSDGRVLVAGGMGVNPGGGAALRLATAELYDPVSNAWTSVGSLATARAHHAATLLADGRVLVTGGSTNDANQETASAELFDPATLAWSPAAALLETRREHQSVRLADGRVMLIGGGHQGSLASTELYDPVTNSWSAGASMAIPRNHSSATVLANGKVLAVGGWDQLGIGVVGTAELYDPASNSWSLAGTLVTGRYGHDAALLPDGRVLIAAGLGTTVLSSAEIYDPAGNAWSATGAMATARYQPASALLANGKVLVTGGSTAAGASLASGEVYDPLTGTWE